MQEFDFRLPMFCVFAKLRRLNIAAEMNPWPVAFILTADLPSWQAC
jgi:hypothetical protein